MYLGIDVITDGEVNRENYIWHFCRELDGFDFENSLETVYRSGACKTELPQLKFQPNLKDPSKLVEEWKFAQSLSKVPVKYTIPGPMTIMDTCAVTWEENEQKIGVALAFCINILVLALAKAGCKNIQIDEPILVRKVEKAFNFGIDHLKLCFQGLDEKVTKTIHLCCGYPNYLDCENYMKAENDCYKVIAEKLDNAGFDQISIEDAHRYNDLDLFDKFKKVTLIIGVIGIARSRVEIVEEIKERVGQILKHIPKERVILAPDCGLGFLPINILEQKLTNMVKAAKADY